MPRRLPALLSLSAVGLLLAGCASAPAAAPTTTTPAEAAGPVTVDNCGTEVTVDSPPERVLTIKSTSTEMMLALGLGDRIIGTAFQDGPLPEDLAADGADLVQVSDKVPGEEAVLELEPDMVYGGWESNFTADGAGDRGELQGLGITTYVSPAACKEAGYQPDPLTWDEVFSEISEVGSIFGVTDAADELIAEQKDEIDSITPNDSGLTALWYSSGSDTPYVGAGIGNPQLLLDTVGLTNIAADVHDTWTSYSWESVVDANPDVIVLVDATWNTAQSKIDRLTSSPATAELDAVKNSRYLIIPFAAGEAGVRSAPAAVDLADQLASLDLD
ncbi:putative F420-0 ABC transporter substrate-binding protein [Amnibacterium flavum]|uniref:Putative F420-0 ABC transporter substrate-binding protein n=2 Tax=Amnibacterium flavum TaxID=2173173 RepID=A0A2V1HU04_9MICO|nr:putative F420-0 ABC transporter substrate-binding protein [Amnibacterium flavum]PVZ96053.1 putative F420-0 ABC transporter substrate-binding protein [Amnibacterium flavum]